MIRLNEEKLARLHTADEILEKEYGAPGTPSRDAFEARAKAWYYAELLKEERKRQKLTQQAACRQDRQEARVHIYHRAWQQRHADVYVPADSLSVGIALLARGGLMKV